MAAARTIALGSALGALAFLGQDTLVDPGFEGKAGKDGRPEGWTFELGATNGATTPESSVELDRGEKHGGKACLRLSGDAATRGWLVAKQPIEVRPGGTYELEAWTQTEGVRPNGFGLDNCYVGLFFFDAAGELAGRELAFPSKPDSPWTKHALRHTAAPHARTGYVYVFLSMIGTLRVDDLALTIAGGERLPAPELVLAEDFTKLKRLGAQWRRTGGATNGTGGADSRVEIDSEVGARAPGSLRLAGDAGTRRWSHLAREQKAEPGELWRWSGKVRAADVVREGPQFQNLHLNLEFLDRRGESLGGARFAALEPGTHDWTPLAVEGVAPEGTRKVRVGVFLSMSGTAWFDDLELTRETGLPVPYGGWITLAGKGIVLRHAPDHPHAGEMKAHLAALEQSKQATCRALEVEFPEVITVFVYKDDAEGRSLTGRELDFADPGGRRVHQRWESYIGHEMVHVIAHTRLQDARTGLLGEGIAVWLNGQHRSHHGDARKLLDEGALPSVRDLLERFGEVPNAYPAAGSFCGFLLDAYGLEVFKQLYPLADPSAKLAELEGQRLEELESAWHEHVRRNG